MRVVKLKHIKYDNSLSEKHYYFKTVDADVEVDTLVMCNTSEGSTIGRVLEIYTSIQELVKIKDLPYMQNLKECRRLYAQM